MGCAIPSLPSPARPPADYTPTVALSSAIWARTQFPKPLSGLQHGSSSVATLRRDCHCHARRYATSAFQGTPVDPEKKQQPWGGEVNRGWGKVRFKECCTTGTQRIEAPVSSLIPPCFHTCTTICARLFAVLPANQFSFPDLNNSRASITGNSRRISSSKGRRWRCSSNCSRSDRIRRGSNGVDFLLLFRLPSSYRSSLTLFP